MPPTELAPPASLPFTINVNTPVTYTSPGTYTLGIPAGTTIVNYTIIGGGGAGGCDEQ